MGSIPTPGTRKPRGRYTLAYSYHAGYRLAMSITLPALVGLTRHMRTKQRLLVED